ncbi:YbhB/YbcL family Raf kinase inhibitor-like protein [Candidatus Woesearchaeota archaeon]|nr:YbhB/YbcL family Raf kinase inhibitor-like protein [Candidatus Woesearchaeota archaeon]
MRIKSVFEEGKEIPSEYTCQGDDINPELTIEDVPEEAKSLVLIMDDPDAPSGTWDHWIVFNIPADTEKIGKDSVPAGAVQGKNSWEKNEYGGPCPPSGTHRYNLKLYALDTELDLDESADKKAVEDAMKGHVAAEAKLTGTYEKS